jgi:prolyl oligopeptidase PreP (S9A serine peptidase family)
MLTRYPERVWRVILCDPADRYASLFETAKLYAGVSWIAEYGDPDDPEN